jgi:hypothetical protein
VRLFFYLKLQSVLARGSAPRQKGFFCARRSVRGEFNVEITCLAGDH